MIKEMTSLHIDAVMDIWLKTTISAHSFIAEDYWNKSYDKVKNEYLPASRTFIYEEDGTVKAFISIIGSSFIGALFVSGEYQGQGLGKMLLDYCKELYPALTLCVYKDILQAVRFYERNGFVVEEERVNEDSGYGEYLMKWDI